MRTANTSQMTARGPTYAIGTEYNTRGKHSRRCRVVDILSTYNHSGELVRIRYVAEHMFSGQVVTDSDVPASTIAMGLIGILPPAPSNERRLTVAEQKLLDDVRDIHTSDDSGLGRISANNKS